MSIHSHRVLEFDKLKEKVMTYLAIEKNVEEIINLKLFTDLSSLQQEFVYVQDCMDFMQYDGGLDVRHLKDICALTEKIKLIGTYLEVDELWDININLRFFRIFQTQLEDLGKYKALRDYMKQVSPLRLIEDLISKAIDAEKQIKDDASLDLRDIRIHKKVLAQNIRRKFDELFEEPSVSAAFQERIITERDGRMVVPVKLDFKGLIKGIEHDRSSSGQTVFIEPLSIVSLNNKMRELETKEKEEIRKILLRLSEQIRNHQDEIYKIGNMILYIDRLQAKANFGLEEACHVPMVQGKEILYLEKARHPFIPKEKVVPLTFEIGKDYKILLITGPNTGGKTVALKTAGLLTLMALSGIPIPASQNSRIGFFQGVFADIGDEQSIEQSLSSFSAHVTNLQDILEQVHRNCLVLLDELGSGTDPTEGSAFAMSIIDYLKEKKCNSIITTHYSEVKAHGYNEEGIETASMEFDTTTLSPTYRLLMGIPGESNALTIAKRLGIPQEIIEKAQSYISEDNKKIELMINNIKNKSESLDKMQAELTGLREAAKMNQEKWEEERKALEREKNEILKKAYEDSEKMMNEMRAKASALIEKIQKEEHSKEQAKQIQKNLNMLSSALKEEKNKTITLNKTMKKKAHFKEGDRVFVKNINQFATVLKINAMKESAQVQAGILKLEVPFEEIRVTEEKKEKTYQVQVHKKIAVRSEIDLRGKMVEEGIHELETYLDRALLNGYHEIYVIHGKGTGALRNGILEYLKTCPYVKDYRIGGHGEGGLGCTVVTLK